jgi:hypothetical protein
MVDVLMDGSVMKTVLRAGDGTGVFPRAATKVHSDHLFLLTHSLSLSPPPPHTPLLLTHVTTCIRTRGHAGRSGLCGHVGVGWNSV